MTLAKWCVTRRLVHRCFWKAFIAATAIAWQWPSTAPAQTSASTSQKPELFVQAGVLTGGTSGATAFSPDGKWYVTGTGNLWQIWSVPLHAELRRISPLPPSILAKLAIAADSKTILALQPTEFSATNKDDSGTVPASMMTTKLSLVDASSGKLQRDLTLAGGPDQVCADPSEMNAALMETASGDVRVISLDQEKVLFSAKLVNKPPANLAQFPSNIFFSTDGKLLYAINALHITVWEWRTGKKVLDFDSLASHAQNLDRQVPVNYTGKSVSTAAEEHYAYLFGSGLSRDGKNLIACSRDEARIFTWNQKDSSFHLQMETSAESGVLNSGCGFVTGNKYYLSTQSEKTGLPSGTILAELPNGQKNHINLNIVAVYDVPKNNLSLLRQIDGTMALLSDTGDVFESPFHPISTMHPAFTKGNGKLLWRAAQDFPLAWDLNTGEANLMMAMHTTGYSLAMSADGNHVAYEESSPGTFEEQISVADIAKGQVVARFPAGLMISMYEPSLNADGSVLAYLSGDYVLHAYNTADKHSLLSLPLSANDWEHLVTSLTPDGRFLAVGVPEGVTVYNLTTGNKAAEFPKTSGDSISFPIQVQFSPDGARLAIATPNEPLKIVLTKNWQLEIQLAPVQEMPIAFSPDGKRIAYARIYPPVTSADTITAVPFTSGLTVDDIATGKQVFTAPDALVSPNSGPAFSADGQFLAVDTGTGMLLLNAHTGETIATLYIFGSDEKYYDWLVVAPNGLFDGSPGAWRRVNWRFNHDTFDVAPVESFFREFYHPALLADLVAGKRPAVANAIENLDRRLPTVTINIDSKNSMSTDNRVKLSLDVSQSTAKVNGFSGGAGARDVRLFRNGALVKAWRENLQFDASGHTTLTADVPIVAGENKFTAYAFNKNNVKSVDATAEMTGADSLQRSGTAYVVTIGINQYAAAQSGALNSLSFAEADANDFGDQFVAQQKKLQEFGAVKLIPLLGANATRENIVQAMHNLTASVQPQDGVFIFYAGHGVAAGEHFYLLPQDFNPAAALSSPKSNAISDSDLSDLLEPLSPARSFLVIDACNSGAVLGGDRFVPGPMNSTGLAQLAYEKDMYILAAAQGNESAMESPSLKGGHGYLTYALVEEGLRTQAAAQEGQVLLRPWFEFASQRVPDLQTVLEKSGMLNDKANGQTSSPLRGLVDEDAPAPTWQHPRVFYRREPETDAFVVAKPQAAQ